jgi:ribonuclease PH
VHGPIAPRLPQHESENAVVSVIIKSGNLSSTYEREWEDFLQNVLSNAIMTSSYPRSVIQLVLQIILADGSVLATALHAAVSALLDAGIEMNVLPTAITCSMGGDSIRLDPSAEEEQGGGTIVLVTANDKVLSCFTSNIQVSLDRLLQCCTLAHRASPAITAFWRLAVEQKVKREAQTLWESTR